MAYDRFLIGGPYQDGSMQTDLRPYAIADEAFESLRNAYPFRGRIRKRFGARVMNTTVPQSEQQLHTRLRINIGATPGPLDVPDAAGIITQIQIGQLFSVGNTLLTVFQLGAGVATLSSDGIVTATIDSTTTPNTITIAGAPGGTAVYYYPSNPVMGLITYEVAPINEEPVFAFDTQFSYQFVGGGWERLGTAQWTGDNSQFFWGTTYRGASSSENLLFVTNYNAPDQLWYWQGAPTNAWIQFNPAIQAAPLTVITLESARIILPFKDRLVCLNVVENIAGIGLTTFRNRCRFSQNGSPIENVAFRQDIAGRGGFIDAPTSEAIVSAQFIKDRLIVFFERSTWELAYTGNQVLPFTWQKINTELGSESTFSSIPFDKAILSVGNVGIHACNGSNVERIDQKIPDLVFNIHNDNQGVFRVHGVRDYYNELAYWTFPSDDNNDVFPTQVLVYNYRTGSWAINDDSITTFGYFQKQDDITWQNASWTWEESVDTWGGGPLQGKFRDIIAGNQQGFVFILDSNKANNSISLQITSMVVVANVVTLTVINHNLHVGDFIRINYATGIIAFNGTIRQVQVVTDANTFSIFLDIGETAPGIYSGAGTLERISRINILSKQYNFYQKQGKNIFLAKVDFLVDKTSYGSIAVDYYPSSSPISLVNDGLVSGSLWGNNVLETSPYLLVNLEIWQDRLWHPVYFQGEGEVVQLRLYFTDDQMRVPQIVDSDFQLHCMIAYTQGVSRLQ